MKIRCLVIFLVSFLFSFNSFGREITGVVLAESDSTRLADVNVKIFSGDNYISGTTSDDNGVFSISTDLKTELRLELESMGYDPAEIFVKPGSGNIELGAIFLSASTTLDELTVTADRVTYSKGRTIIFPSESEVKSSSTSLSLFEKLPLPGITIDHINRSISVDGGSPVYLVNGVPTDITNIRNLKPGDIEKIEYSRTTPMRYADGGYSGLVSITLKASDDGGSVFIYGRSALTSGLADGDIRVSYHQGPSRFTLSYNPSWRDVTKVYDYKKESFIAPDFRVDQSSNSVSPFHYLMQTGKLQYEFSKPQSILFSATFSFGAFNDGRHERGETFNSMTGDYEIDNNSKNKELNPSLDLFFRRDFNEKNSLEIQAVGTLKKSSYDWRNRFIYPDEEDIYSSDLDSHRLSLITEVSYTHQFSESSSLGAGFQNTVTHSRNKYRLTNYEPTLDENNNYLYAQYGYQIKRVYLGLATGLKIFHVENDMNKHNFIRNLSMATVAWNINQKWNINFNFRYTPDIPTLASLTDYPEQETQYLVSNGNPDLKVTDIFYYGITPTFNYKKLNLYSVLEYVRINSPVYGDYSYLGNGLFLSQSANAKKFDTMAFTLGLSINNLAGFGFNGRIYANRYICNGYGWTQTLSAIGGYFSIWWNKGPFTITFMSQLPGKRLYGTSVSKGEQNNMLRLEYKLGNHWTFGASWMCMFQKNGLSYPGWNYSAVHPQEIMRHIKDNGNMVLLEVTYNTDFGTIFRTSNRSLRNSDTGSSFMTH